MIRRFNRYELKYRIHAKDRDSLLSTMLTHMRADREGAADGIYQVTSMYYDTHDLSCYRAKLDGVNYRRKLRIRRYGPAPAPAPSTDAGQQVVMVEIKQRINRTTQKRRVALPLAEAYALCDGALDRRFEDPLDQAVAEEVSFLVGAQQLSPNSVISYRRRALVGSQYEPGLRITFDEEITVSDASRGLDDGARRVAVLPPDQVILEVKSNDVVPLWVSRLLASRSVRLVRFSKYCAGIARLRNGEDRWMS